MRFPRIARIRWDKPAAEADSIAALEDLLARHTADAGDVTGPPSRAKGG
jgi:hypothetical protein